MRLQWREAEGGGQGRNKKKTILSDISLNMYKTIYLPYVRCCEMFLFLTGSL